MSNSVNSTRVARRSNTGLDHALFCWWCDLSTKIVAHLGAIWLVLIVVSSAGVADSSTAESPFAVFALENGAKAVRIFKPGLPSAKLMLEYYPPVAPTDGTSEGVFRVFRADGKPFPEDDLISIEIKPISYYSASLISTMVEIVLREGDVESFGTLVQTPALNLSGVYAFELRVSNKRGRLLGLEDDYFNNLGIKNYDSVDYPNLLVLPATQKGKDQYFKNSLMSLDKREGMYRAMKVVPQRFLPLGLSGELDSARCLVSRMPENWLLLTGFEKIFLHQSDWQTLTEAQKSALQSYVDSGGILIFTGCEKIGYEMLKSPLAVELLGQSVNRSSVLKIDQEPLLRDWSPFYEFIYLSNSYTNNSYTNNSYTNNSYTNNSYAYGSWIEDGPYSDRSTSSSDWDFGLNKWLNLLVGYIDLRLFSVDAFARRMDLLPGNRSGILHVFNQLVRAAGKTVSGDFSYLLCGKGAYCFISQANPSAFEESLEERITAVVSEYFVTTSEWATNRGFDSDGQSNSYLYSHGLISQIGRPPVLWFAGLLGIFSLIVGPGILLLTSLVKRQTWLMIFFPVVGLLFTIGLFIFAILHDGFDTFTRVRSFTTYDDRTGTAFCTSQQTHFSGAPPEDGLVFEADTEVTNLLLQRETLSRSRVEFHDGKQHWTNSVRAREQCQYLVQHPLPKRDRLNIEQNGDTLSITNLSGSNWKFFAFYDVNNRLWMGDGLSAGQKIELQSVALDKECSEALKLIKEVYDEGSVPVEAFSKLDVFSLDVRQAQSGTSSSIMQTMLQHWEPVEARKAKNRQFIAVLEEPEYVDYGYDDSNFVEDAHFLFGRW